MNNKINEASLIYDMLYNKLKLNYVISMKYLELTQIYE